MDSRLDKWTFSSTPTFGLPSKYQKLCLSLGPSIPGKKSDQFRPDAALHAAQWLPHVRQPHIQASSSPCCNPFRGVLPQLPFLKCAGNPPWGEPPKPPAKGLPPPLPLRRFCMPLLLWLLLLLFMAVGMAVAAAAAPGCSKECSSRGLMTVSHKASASKWDKLATPVAQQLSLC